MDVTVVVPTRDRPALLAETLRSLRAQKYDGDWQIVVVDDGSNPPVTAGTDVQVIRHPRPRGLNAARNTGARVAKAEFVWFIDDDVALPDGWLAEIGAGAARHPNSWFFGGPVRLRFEETILRSCPRCAAQAGDPETELDPRLPEGSTGEYMYGANLGLRKDALATVGPWDESRPIYYEEIEWQDRLRAAGGTTVYLPAAGLWHRRVAENMRLGRRLARSFRKGIGYAYYRRSSGLPVNRLPLWRAAAHVVRYRCVHGIVLAAESAGRAFGSMRYRRVTG